MIPMGLFVTAARILIVHEDGLDDSPYFCGLIAGLLARDHEVAIATCQQPDGDSAGQKFEERGARFHPVPAPRQSDGDGEPSASWITARCEELDASLRQIARRERPGLFIANHAGPGAAAALRVARTARVPGVVVFHGKDFDSGAAGSEAMRDLVRENIALSSRVVVLSHADATRAASVLSIDDLAAEVIPHGIATDSFAEPGNGFRDSKAAFIGSVAVEDGAHLVIAAMPVALSLLPTIQVSIVGDGPDRADLEDLVRSLNAGDHVRSRWLLRKLGATPERGPLVEPALRTLFGDRGKRRRATLVGRLDRHLAFEPKSSQPEALRALQRSRVALLPWLTSHGDDRTLLQALAQGCAVAATPLGDHADWLRDLKSAIPAMANRCTIDSNTPVTSLGHAMVAGVRSWRPSFGTELAHYARDHYDWSVIGERLVQLASELPPPRLWV